MKSEIRYIIDMSFELVAAPGVPAGNGNEKKMRVDAKGESKFSKTSNDETPYLEVIDPELQEQIFYKTESCAARENFCQSAKALSDLCKTNSDKFGRNPGKWHREQCEKEKKEFIDALKKNKVEVVKSLLKKGATPHIVIRYDWKWYYPLHIAAIRGNTKMASVLLEHGAEVDAILDEGPTALKLSIEKEKNKNISKLLLEKGADPNLPSGSEKLTPLMSAVVHSKVEGARILLSKGANPNIQLGGGNTALHMIWSLGPFRAYELGSLLLEEGADPNIQNESGDTPLHKAAEKGDVKIVELLVNNNARNNIKNLAGMTPKSVAKFDEFLTVTKERFMEMKKMLSQRPGIF